jgi:hypothetical protein
MNQPASSTEVRRNTIGGWEANFSSVTESVTQNVVNRLIDILHQWQSIFPLANTWVGQEYKIPSLFVRLDFVIHDGKVWVYEIEDRPCGLGFTSAINTFFAERAAAMKKKWPEIRWVKSAFRETDDEPFFGPPLSLEDALTGDYPHLLVRSRPEEVAYHPLEERSVSTVSEEGNKRYGTALKWWDIVTAHQNEDGRWYLDSPLQGPCVVKPVQGTRARLVMVHYPNQNPEATKKQSRTDIVTGGGEIRSVGALIKTIAQQPNRQMCVQPFIPPMRLPHQPHLNTIYRFLFGFDPVCREWVPLGGTWNALDRLIVHGTDRTVFGPLVFQS